MALPRVLKAFAAFVDGTNYMAIGGVSPANIREFFDAGCISVGLASSLMPKDAVAANDFSHFVRLGQEQ